MYATKHQPEGALHSWNRRAVLQAKVRPSPFVVAQSVLHRRLEAAGLKRLTLRTVLRVLMHLEDEQTRALVVDAAGAPAFQLLPPQVQLAVLRAIERAIEDREEVHRIASLAIDPVFGSLGAVLQHAIVRAIEDHPRTSLASDLARLIRRPHFRDGREIELIGYAAGPRPAPLIAAARRQRLESFWEGRRAALLRKDGTFLAEPAVVWFLDASSVNGHAAIVFGAPRDPRSLSYGFRWVASRDGLPMARAYSPDPMIASGWPRDVVYAAEKLTMPRRIEPLLMGWIEQSYALFGDRGGTKPPPSPAGLYQAALEAAIQLSQGKVRIERLLMRGER